MVSHTLKHFQGRCRLRGKIRCGWDWVPVKQDFAAKLRRWRSRRDNADGCLVTIQIQWNPAIVSRQRRRLPGNELHTVKPCYDIATTQTVAWQPCTSGTWAICVSPCSISLSVCLPFSVFMENPISLLLITREIQLGDGRVDQKSGADHFHAEGFDAVFPQNQFFHRFVYLQRLKKKTFLFEPLHSGWEQPRIGM